MWGGERERVKWGNGKNLADLLKRAKREVGENKLELK